MNLYLTYASLGLLVLLPIFSGVFYKSYKWWKFLLTILLGGVYIVITFFRDAVTFVDVTVVETYYPYALYFFVLFYSLTFKSKIKITQNLTDYDFFELEKELDEMKSTSELLRLRYISTISILPVGLLFYDDDLHGLFATDQFLEITGTKDNNLSLEAYTSLIHKDDQAAYLQNIKRISKKQMSFEMKYRILRGNSFVWVIENVKVFEFDKKLHLISTVKGMDIKLFPDTSIHEIDSLPQENQLFQYLNQAMKETEPFYLIMIHLTNIPDINQRYGREVGNLMIAEYIKKMRYHFAKDVNSVFRITGIQFALIIKEQRKYEVLLRALQSGGDLINLSINIGGIQQVIYPNLGIVKRDPWSTYSMNELISLSNKALGEAITNIKKNYAILGE